MRIGFAVVRVVVAVGIVAAIVGQLLTSLDYWPSHNVTNITLAVTNFFSFFTIDSNIGSVVVLLVGAFFLVARKGADPRWFTILRASVASYMIVTGIVYNLLLRNIELPQGATLEWSNEILHVVGPLWLLIDWLYAPGRSELPWKTIWTIIAFPLVWVAYTMIRGPFTPNEQFGGNWYPYPFLNPATSANGYLSVSFYVILIAVVIGLTGAGVIWITRRGKGMIGNR